MDGPLRSRFVIIATVLALALMPCAKISAAYAKSVSQTNMSVIDDAAVQAGVELAVSGPEQGTDTQCLTCCKQWQGVVPRFEAMAAPAQTAELVVAIWLHQESWPRNASRLSGMGARSPPEPGGTAFQAFFARTSRFLS